jgi:hypothetical protein
MSETVKSAVDEEELQEAKKSAASSVNTFELTFASPWSYEGKTYDKITFDFGKLTGRDGLAIEAELQGTGRAFLDPMFNGAYLARMACRASTPRISVDVLEAMPLAKFSKVRNAARNFLLRSES